MTKEEDGAYQIAAYKKDLHEGSLLKIELHGKPILLSMVNGKVYAIDAICSHEGGPLEEGTLDRYEIKCPWHGSKFDVRTGEVKNPPTDIPQVAYEVKSDNDKILIKEKPKSEGPQQQTCIKKESPLYELTLLEKKKVQGTDMMSLKFSKQNNLEKSNENDEDVKEEDENKKLLSYTAGQYAYFDIGGVTNDPRGPIRHFTIASSPTENFILISTRIRDSPYKKRLASLEEMAKVKVRGPEGKFVLHDDHSKPAVFLSGGIGVTPFRSMIKDATDRHLPIKIIMFDSNRNEENILYKMEFDEWANTNKNLKIVYTVTDEDGSETLTSASSSSSSSNWTGQRGRIDKDMLNKYLSSDDINRSVFYVCGPPAMLNAMKSILEKELQIANERIKAEEFTGY